MALRDDIARVLHESRMKLCWGKNIPANKMWPADDRELRQRMHHGDPLLDQAYVQADAVLRSYKVERKPQ